jgi:hypothetical protein
MPLVLVENKNLTKTHGWQQSWVFVLIRAASHNRKKHEQDN